MSGEVLLGDLAARSSNSLRLAEVLPLLQLHGCRHRDSTPRESTTGGLRLFRELYTDAVDVVFAFGFREPCTNWCRPARLLPPSVSAFIEQGTTTTPFDMTVKDEASRYHLAMDALNNA